MSNSDTGSLSDGQLVEAIRQNDSAAFQLLYYRYYKPLFRFAWYRLHSTELIRDLLQELFFKLWMNRNQLDPERSIKAYLYKSLTNLIINHLKLHSSHSVSFDNITELTTGKEDNPDMMIDIQNLLNHLPEKLKMVFMLSRVEGYKYNEIAEICGISIKAVEKRMSTAFDILRKFFQEMK